MIPSVSNNVGYQPIGASLLDEPIPDQEGQQISYYERVTGKRLTINIDPKPNTIRIMGEWLLPHQQERMASCWQKIKGKCLGLAEKTFKIAPIHSGASIGGTKGVISSSVTTYFLGKNVLHIIIGTGAGGLLGTVGGAAIGYGVNAYHKKHCPGGREYYSWKELPLRTRQISLVVIFVATTLLSIPLSLAYSYGMHE